MRAATGSAEQQAELGSGRPTMLMMPRREPRRAGDNASSLRRLFFPLDTEKKRQRHTLSSYLFFFRHTTLCTEEAHPL